MHCVHLPRVFRRSGHCTEFLAGEREPLFESSCWLKTLMSVRRRFTAWHCGVIEMHSVRSSRCLSQDDPLLRRLAAMALGRIGDSEAVEPLLQTYSTEMDPFLSHAIVYALYEIGDVQSLPESHPLGKQVLLMRKADQRSIRTDALPKDSPREMEKTRSREARPAGTTSQ